MIINNEKDLVHNRLEVAAQARKRIAPRILEYPSNDRLKLVFDLEMLLTFLATALRYNSSSLFSEYSIWTQHLLVSAGGNADDFTACLVAIEAELVECGRGDWVARAQRCLDTARVELDSALPADESFLSEDNPHRLLAGNFLQTCLEMKRPQALKIVHDAANDGISIQEIYSYVITPALRELGRLWHNNKITVAQEHYCTAVVQMIMAQLFPSIFGHEQKLGTLVSSCVAGELHEVGARMLTDLFEVAGWDTIYLGADVPDESVIDVLIQHDADILAISATIAVRLNAVADLIQAVRENPASATIKIMVGGAAFNADPRLWKRLGADGWASDPDEAIALAASWKS
ncbi:MAG: cobalamin-dependent protein [Candidatus Thiodiazotropha sp. 6PDIVS]